MSIKQQIDNIPNKWKDIILSYSNIDELIKNVENNYTYQEQNNTEDEVILKTFPRKENIFRCFTYCEPEAIKVVIIGQDPYHGEGQATGLCFGVNQDCKIPPSLRNINKELQTDVNSEIKDTTLEKWANQGILLINASLTVKEHCPNSHAKIWKGFTEHILNYLNKNTENKIFVAWGAFAFNKLFNKSNNLDINKHSLIVSSHPSPLSANKPFRNFQKFLGSKTFSKINYMLAEKKEKQIEW